MRVLFWSDTLWPSIGGVQRLASRLLPALSARGHELAVVTSDESRQTPWEERYRSIPIHRFPFLTALRSGEVDRVVRLRQAVTQVKRSFAPDLVHVNDFGPGVLFHLDSCRVSPARSVLTLHTYRDQGREARPAETLLGRAVCASDWVTAVSSAVLTQACRFQPEIASRSSVIYSGVEIPEISPRSLPFEPAVLLCLGRLAPEKGFDLAVTAFRSVVDVLPATRLVIAGDGPERPRLARQVSALGLAHAVEFTGWIDPRRVPDLVNRVTLLVAPSLREGLPLAALEASSMARPVVAARIGGLPEVVVDHDTGLLVDPRNASALSEAILCLLSNPEIAVRMGQAARRRAQTCFDWQCCVDAYDGLYQRLGGAQAGAP